MLDVPDEPERRRDFAAAPLSFAFAVASRVRATASPAASPTASAASSSSCRTSSTTPWKSGRRVVADGVACHGSSAQGSVVGVLRRQAW